MKRLNRARCRSALETRLAAHRGDRGVALLTALMFMLFATGLSLVLLSVILSQAVPAYTAQKNTRTVYAAQAGLQSALALIRSADAPPDLSLKVYGKPADLPCSVSGNVAADGTGASYSVSIQYFTSDPTNTTDSWRAANMMACSVGVSTVPKYAYVSSRGQDSAIPGNADAAAGNRALSAIYKFNTTNVNIEGGMIRSANSAYCLEADVLSSGAIGVGSKVKFALAAGCSNQASQLWVYSTDYELKLASSIVGGAAGLCITGPATDGADTQDITLTTCKSAPDGGRWNQLWSWVGSYTWSGQSPTTLAPSRYCLDTGYGAAVSLTGKFLQVKKNCGNAALTTYSPTGSFAPSLAVGAGAASYDTHQLVNYLEFGRCADVTSEVWSSAFMISYPCKQDPTGTGNNLLWNHKWYYSEPTLPDPVDPTKISSSLGPQQIYIYLEAAMTNKRCLTAPTSGSGNVTFSTCNSASVLQQWTRVKDTGDYSSSYLMLNQGKCLFVNQSDVYTNGGRDYSKIQLANCNGSLSQKWNAPSTNVGADFGGYREVAG